MDRPTRRGFLAAAGAATVAGCTGRLTGAGSDSATATSDGPGTASGWSFPVTDRPKPLPSAPESLREAARSGGPGKDGIPAIDDPTFIAPDAADFLSPGDIVFGTTRDGQPRAYPQKVLVWHEVCNDTLGGVPGSVTYCPLTGTVLGFLRGETSFGVSGRLINNNLVMYDRETEAWWPQVLATTIPGPWNGNPETASLREFRLVWTTWERWQRQYPATDVLSTETGHARNYGRDPYGSYNPTGGYYESKGTLFPRLNPDDRFHPKTVVLGARTPDGAVSFLKSSLLANGSMSGSIGTETVLAVADGPLQTGYVYRNPEDISVTVADGEVTMADGSTHAPAALPLERIHAFDAMWFAWSGFYPDGEVNE